MNPEVAVMLDFIEMITYGVSTALMFVGLGVMAVVAYWLVVDR